MGLGRRQLEVVYRQRVRSLLENGQRVRRG
jgi:hypothetical protein